MIYLLVPLPASYLLSIFSKNYSIFRCCWNGPSSFIYLILNFLLFDRLYLSYQLSTDKFILSIHFKKYINEIFLRNNIKLCYLIFIKIYFFTRHCYNAKETCYNVNCSCIRFKLCGCVVSFYICIFCLHSLWRTTSWFIR